ncbi:MAG: hypothetical protein V2A78_03220 [bacterium]
MNKNIFPVILFLFLVGITSTLAQADSEPQHPYNNPLWGDTSPNLGTLVNYYKIDKTTIQSIGQDLTDPMDIHPSLFLAKAASISPMVLFEQRKNGDSWMFLIRKYNINPVLLYTPLDNAKPPAEFDHAYAQREHLAKDSNYQVKLYDSEVRDLLGLKFCVEALAIPPQEIFDRMSGDMDLEDTIVESVYNSAGKAVPPSLQHLH